jgi:hypothetical protein
LKREKVTEHEQHIAYLEKELRRRGVEPPVLRSTNPDPVAREAEERKLIKKFWDGLADDLMKKLGIQRSSKKSGKKGVKR